MGENLCFQKPMESFVEMFMFNLVVRWVTDSVITETGATQMMKTNQMAEMK